MGRENIGGILIFFGVLIVSSWIVQIVKRDSPLSFLLTITADWIRVH